MNIQKLIRLTLAGTLCILLAAGCGNKTSVETEVPTAKSTTIESTTAESTATESTTAAPVEISGELLKNVSLSLPDEVTREDVSNTRAVFRHDGNIIGGIEILNIAGQRDTLPFSDDYRDLAEGVTKLVRDDHYDYTLDKATPLADLEVYIIFWGDHQCFAHYFFFGETVVYDIWADNEVLNGQDMISILKTLHSEDIINPQDTAPANEDVLNLRIDLPDGIIRMPSTTTRLLFYNIPSLNEYVTGENVVGGVEVVTDATDFLTMEDQLVALGGRYIGGKFKTEAQPYSDSNVLSRITATSTDVQLVAYVIQVEADTYAVWGTTSVIPEEALLEIAKSCKY